MTIRRRVFAPGGTIAACRRGPKDHAGKVRGPRRLTLKATGADPKLVEYRDAEVLTTRTRRVDLGKAATKMGHKTTVTLDEGIRKTVAWMPEVYKI